MNVSDFMKSNGLIHDMDQELLDLTLESFGGLTDNQVALLLPNNKVSGWLLLNEIKAFLEECRDADTESEPESESDPDSICYTDSEPDSGSELVSDSESDSVCYTDSESDEDSDEDIEIIEGATINLSSRTVSVLLKRFPENNGIPSIEERLTELSKDMSRLEHIKTLDLSVNRLLSSDLKYIYDFVSKFPSTQRLRVNISYNGIIYMGVEDEIALKDIVDLKQVEFLNIKGNALINPNCFEDSNPILESLKPSDELTKKLIWIDKKLVSKHLWTAYVKEDVREIIEQSHLTYYS